MKTLAFFFALMVPVFGRLGETVDQCRARYGAESKRDSDSSTSKTFVKGGMEIHVTFKYGIAKDILISHFRENTSSQGEPLTSTEITILLEANRGGSTWKQSESIGGLGKMWETADGKRTAMSEANSLFISDSVEVKPPPETEKQQLQNLKGF